MHAEAVTLRCVQRACAERLASVEQREHAAAVAVKNLDDRAATLSAREQQYHKVLLDCFLTLHSGPGLVCNLSKADMTSCACALASGTAD